MFLSKPQCKKNPRALYLKYLIETDLENKNAMASLWKSCLLGYPNSICELGHQVETFLKKLSSTEIENLLFSISAQMGSPTGQGQVGNRIILGDGFNKDLDKGAQFLYKCISQGHRS